MKSTLTVWGRCRQDSWVLLSGDILTAPRAVGTRRPNVEGQPGFVHNHVRAVYLHFEGSSRVREAPSQPLARGCVDGGIESTRSSAPAAVFRPSCPRFEVGFPPQSQNGHRY